MSHKLATIGDVTDKHFPELQALRREREGVEARLAQLRARAQAETSTPVRVAVLPSRMAPVSLLDRRPDDKTKASADAAADVAAFLAAGGKIQQIPAGLSAETPQKVADAVRSGSFRVVQDMKEGRRARS